MPGMSRTWARQRLLIRICHDVSHGIVDREISFRCSDLKPVDDITGHRHTIVRIWLIYFLDGCVVLAVSCFCDQLCLANILYFKGKEVIFCCLLSYRFSIDKKFYLRKIRINLNGRNRPKKFCTKHVCSSLRVSSSAVTANAIYTAATITVGANLFSVLFLVIITGRLLPCSEL